MAKFIGRYNQCQAEIARENRSGSFKIEQWCRVALLQIANRYVILLFYIINPKNYCSYKININIKIVIVDFSIFTVTSLHT